MKNEIRKIASVHVELPTTVLIDWKDGRSDVIDLAGWIGNAELLAPLRDPKVFARGRVDEYGAAVIWDDAEILAIDSLHLDLIAREQKPFSTDELIAWQQEAGMTDDDAADFVGASPSE